MVNHQIAFKKTAANSDGSSQQNKLTMDLDKGHQKNQESGVLTRYMTVQVQLLETMKSVKDQALMVTTCLMFPQVYGFESKVELPRHESLDIVAPEGDKVLATSTIGLEQNLVYKIGEIEGAKDLSRRKCAVFAFSDETKVLENAEQFEKAV